MNLLGHSNIKQEATPLPGVIVVETKQKNNSKIIEKK